MLHRSVLRFVKFKVVLYIQQYYLYSWCIDGFLDRQYYLLIITHCSERNTYLV